MFARYTRNDGLVFKHAKGMRDVLGREFHHFYEIFVLTGGRARFTSDEYDESLSPGSLIIIPKESYHRFDALCEESDYQRYVIQFEDESELSALISDVTSRVRIIHDLPDDIFSLFKSLDKAQEREMCDVDQSILLRSVFCRILIELKYSMADNNTALSQKSPATSSIIAYVDAHFTEPITVSGIANALHFSSAYVCHRFKDEMGTSLYQYILKKKLVHAYNLIKSGMPATEAAHACGFTDYSTFYKRYKAHFGTSPSQFSQS